MALPSNIPLDRFKATFITAVAHNPEILQCDMQSIKTALMKAAVDNLLPDNREAALVPFNTKGKDAEGKERWMKIAQYMPMVQGIRKRALELGGARIFSECVYENDFFDAVLGDDPHIEHKPAKLGQVRGEIIGAYAIFKDEKGEILHRELMPREDIEAARNVSRAKDGPGWKNFYGEFARKTVVRRGSKSVPSIPEKLRTIIERDDDYVDFSQIAERPRSIEHNPLLDRKQLESNSQQPMERVDTSTGEILKSGVQREATGKQTSSAPKDDESRASAKPASDDAGRGGGASKQDSRPNNSSEQSSFTSGTSGAAGGKEGSTSSLSADILKRYAGAMARMNSTENVDRASDAFWKENGGAPGKDTAHYDLAVSIYKRQFGRAKGDIQPEGLMDEINAEIDTAFGADKFPGDL